MFAQLADWRPSVSDVASLVPERTGAIDGPGVVPRGTFDTTTVPTAAQVDGLIRGVQNEVTPQVGGMPLELCAVPDGGTIGESAAGHVVALGAAALVEASFYPDMQLGGDSPATMLEKRYRLALTALVKAANDIIAGSLAGVPPKPRATFPDTVSYGYATTSWERW